MCVCLVRCKDGIPSKYSLLVTILESILTCSNIKMIFQNLSLSFVLLRGGGGKNTTMEYGSTPYVGMAWGKMTAPYNA